MDVIPFRVSGMYDVCTAALNYLSRNNSEVGDSHSRDYEF